MGIGFNNGVSQAFKKMNKNRHIAKAKGDAGEEILLALAKEFQKKRDCIILHSYTYPYQTDKNNKVYPGNIKLEDGKFILLQKEGYNDEIDVVIMTSYRIFCIECKARGGTWKVYDHWTSQDGKKSDKSPITQAEKHARHFYHLIHEVLPNGKPNYIIPVTVFVDKSKIKDSRSIEFKEYIPVTIANLFKKLLVEYDTPLEYNLDVEYILRIMMEKGKGAVYRSGR